MKVVEFEISEIQGKALELAKDADAWAQWVGTFYGRHVGYVSETMCISREKAKQYCDEQSSALLENGVIVTELWRPGRVIALASLALEGAL